MRKFVVFVLLSATVSPAAGQCFNRAVCDSSTYEIRSQLSVTIPLPDNSHLDEAIKVVESAQNKMTMLSSKELETVKSIYGNDAVLRQANINSNMQDFGTRGTSATVSLNSVYAVKKDTK